jgi:SIR2-like domain
MAFYVSSQYILLLGAGFSRNWGGYLSSEVAGHLLTCKEVQTNVAVRNALLRQTNVGSFEAALGELQGQFRRSGSSQDKVTVEDFQNALSKMFEAMDRGYRERLFEFQNNRETLVRTFLTKFDAIFTLNQDYLLERHYLNGNVMLGSEGKWQGWQIPGMVRIHSPNATPFDSAQTKWKPDQTRFLVEPRYQPYFKLHGSCNWLTADGDQLMILGSDKTAQIQGQEILRWSFQQFEGYLSKPTRLMTIGYGFRDHHVTKAIANGAERGSVKLFVIDTSGINALDQHNRSLGGAIYAPSEMTEAMKGALIGVSSRQMSETFRDDYVEHAKVMTFFDA